MVITKILIALIGILHVYILILEMFLWEHPIGLKVFGHAKGNAVLTKVLAQNQGLYNGFLAAGLFWALLVNEVFFRPLATFFLGCVFVAGIYGAATANKKILFIQSVPALIALIFLYVGI